MIGTKEETLGKDLQKKLGGKLVVDREDAIGRRTGIDDIITTEEIIYDKIVGFYKNKGFNHVENSRDHLMFNMGDKSDKGYITITYSYFEESKTLMVTEDTSQFKF